LHGGRGYLVKLRLGFWPYDPDGLDAVQLLKLFNRRFGKRPEVAGNQPFGIHLREGLQKFLQLFYVVSGSSIREDSFKIKFRFYGLYLDL
jgi:hypothetical protein